MANAHYCIDLVSAFTSCLQNAVSSMALDLVYNRFRAIGEYAVFKRCQLHSPCVVNLKSKIYNRKSTRIAFNARILHVNYQPLKWLAFVARAGSLLLMPIHLSPKGLSVLGIYAVKCYFKI